MQQIFPLLERLLQTQGEITFHVLDPDTMEGHYAGETVVVDGETYLYRSLRVWMELAELLGCRMRVPEKGYPPLLYLTFVKIASDSFHLSTLTQKEEKYGSNSLFSKIHKMEEIAFYYYYRQALQNVDIAGRKRLLNLGVNRGDEFEVIRNGVEEECYRAMELIGVDHAASAIAEANYLFPEENVTFYTHDITKLEMLELGRFDLLISIGTLQSLKCNFKPFFMTLVQTYLEKDAALILGFPNSRWYGGEMVYGAKAPNYAMSEMSLVLNDIHFCKKYLQQKKYRVTVTGKQYLFLTATKIGSS